MMEFVTAVKDHAADEVGFDIPITLDKGTENEWKMTVYKPSEGQLTAFTALAGDDLASNAQVVARSINFLNSLLDPEDQRYLARRLLDRHDEFGGEDVANILTKILEEWGGKGGGSHTASQRSRRPSGKATTARQRSRA